MVKNNIIIITLLFLFGVSCSQLSKNIVRKGNFKINHGVSGDEVWKESLDFKRISWLQELSIVYEVLIAKIDKDSPFIAWFSEGEKKSALECPTFYITARYSKDSHKISHPMFQKEMLQNGLKEVSLPNFANSLRLHPNYETENLDLHKINGYCRTSSEGVRVSFPSFRAVTIIK